MNGADVIAIVALVLVAAVLKEAVSKGPKWKRDMEYAGKQAAERGE